ncbi:MAG: sugar transferase, partial [Candidatus Dormibacteria bacterium]
MGTAATVLGLGKLHAKYIGHYELHTSEQFAWSLAYIALLCVFAYGMGLPDVPTNAGEAFSSAALGTVGAAVVISVFQLVLGSLLLPRFVVFSSAVLLVPGWMTAAFIAHRGGQRQAGRDRVVAVVTKDDAAVLAEELTRAPERPASLVRALTIDEAVMRTAVGPALLEAAATARATVLVLDRHAQADDEVLAQAARLHEQGMRVRALSFFYDEWLGKLPIAELERMSLMFDIREVHRARYSRAKRTFDMLLALAALPILLVVTPLVALGNMVGNRGPLFFRQPRVGRDNVEFPIWKFRTMRPHAGGPSHWTTADDPRITPFGRFLRRRHIDELPQVLNLLKGEIAMVGPRPEQPQYVEELTEKIRFYRLRHVVRPGITGWA